MDSVAGVGYSYSLDTDDYATNDTQAQIDMEATLRTWFQEYPYFANHSVILEGKLPLCACFQAYPYFVNHSVFVEGKARGRHQHKVMHACLLS